MSSPRMEEDGVLREWAPLSRLLQQIPLRIRAGLFLEDVKFTCVDADSECIAVGTSTGTVFWYDRRTHVVQQLKPENCKYSLTCIKVVTSVEYMVAVGDSSGVVTIFRLPKQLPDWVQPKKPEQIERYTVDDLHKSEVTALAWSINGQKLFSGDSLGSVVYTEIDYCMSLSRTCEILNEKYKIYQLCYNQHEQALIVATELRCIICHYNKPNWRIVQIGQRERHNLMDLGACFYTDENGKLGVYSCRGGLRLWKADLEGNVKNTIMFKNVINPEKESVRLIRSPFKCSSSAAKKSLEFGKFNYWKDGLFVSYREECLLVLDPSRISVVCYLADLTVPLTEVALTQGEMFVVMGDRELIRLAYAPDAYDSSIGGFGNMASGEPVSSLPKFDLNPVVGAVLIPHIIPPSRIKLSAATANNELSANEVMYGTDSTSLLPPVKALRDGVPELRLDTSRNHQFSAIGQQEFDEIIYAKSKYRKHKKKRRNSADESFKVNVETCRNSWSSFQTKYTQESSSCNDCEQKNDFNLPKEILPDMRTLDAIVKDLKEKEMLLDAALVFPTSKDDSDHSKSELFQSEEHSQLNNIEDISTDLKVEVDDEVDEDSTFNNEKKQAVKIEKIKLHQNGFIENTSSKNRDKEKREAEATFQIKSNSESELPMTNLISESLDGNKLNQSGRVLFTTELSQDSFSSQELVSTFDIVSQEGCSGLSVEDPTVSDGILVNIADSSEHCVADSELYIQKDKKSHLPLENDIGLSVDGSSTYSFQLKNLHEGWFEMTCPEKAVFLSNQNGIICNDVLFMCSPGFLAYALCKNKWIKLPYKARCICISPQQEESQAVSAVRLHCSIAYFSSLYSFETVKFIFLI